MGLTRLLKATTRRTAKAALYLAGLVAAVLATIVVVFAAQARLRLPDLQPWHRIELAEEFRAGRAGAPKAFPEYLALEQRLFAELRKRVLDDPAVADRALVGATTRMRPPSLRSAGRTTALQPSRRNRGAPCSCGLTDSPTTWAAP
jgi:hypothetical protein